MSIYIAHHDNIAQDTLVMRSMLSEANDDECRLSHITVTVQVPATET